MTAPHEMTAVELRDALASGQLGAEEVAAHFLSRVDALNPGLGAFLTPTPELALAEARAADERRARGEQLGMLHGMPLAHKDLTDVAGVRVKSAV